MFIDDLEALTVENPTLFKGFQDGKFVVKSSIAPYSKIAFDQKHEQNNKTIKSESVYINMVNMEDKEYLRKLEICFPVIHAFLENNYPERNP